MNHAIYSRFKLLKEIAMNIIDCMYGHHAQSKHCDTIVSQVITSRTAPFYCILLKVHFTISFHITVILHVTSTLC